jgi:hypothetical protein
MQMDSDTHGVGTSSSAASRLFFGPAMTCSLQQKEFGQLSHMILLFFPQLGSSQ